MKPLMIGPDGLVESATRRETAHLTHYLGHGQTCQPVKARRNAPPMKICPLCNSHIREDRLQRHLSSRCPSRPGLGSRFGPSDREINDCPREASSKVTPRADSKISDSRTPSSTQPVMKCPACEFKGASDDFTRHFAIAHGTKGRLRRRIQVPMVCIAERFTGPGGQSKEKSEDSSCDEKLPSL